MTLKSFPRGGKKPTTKAKNKPSFERKEASKKTRKNHEKKTREVAPPEEEKSYVADKAECLKVSGLGEGQIVLGRIDSTTEYDMTISLPGRLNGKIQATDVSESYTNLLRDVINPEVQRNDEFKPLSELYNRGKYVVCYVKSVTPDEKYHASLSLEPELINRNLDPTKLRKGSKIVGTVSSVEDHGYVIDTGIDNLRCFLDSKDMDEGVKYYPGKQLFCGVKKVKTSENSTTAHVTTKSKHVSTAISSNEQSLDAQIPGTRFLLSVEKILSNGLRVSFNNDNVGYVNRIYLDKPLESYVRGNEINGVLMYVMPTLKFAYFTLLPSDESKERLNVGDTFERAKVSFIGATGILMSLKNETRGWIPFRRTEIPYEKISSTFLHGTTHKCRIMAYNLFEQLYICTMESKLLRAKHFSTSSLEAGERMRVKIVQAPNDAGYTMVSAGRIKGWVPPEHMADPETTGKIVRKIGNNVEARVLGPDRRRSGVLFTLKKSLVESTLPILRDFAEAKIDAKHDGTIVQITHKGMLVSFYNDAKGWIPAKLLNKKSPYKTADYTIGQSITTRIERIEDENKKLILDVFTDDVVEDEEINFEIGENVEGVIVEASIQGVCLSVSRNPGDKSQTAFLPAGHLSPCREIGGYLAARCVIGETMSALVFSKKPHFLLTRTFVPGEKYRNFKKLKVGDCLPCSINEITRDSLKVVLPIDNYDSYGIVTRSNVDNSDSLYANQILFAKITSINQKNRKINLAASLHSVWNEFSSNRDNDLIASVDVLTLYLNKLRELTEQDYYKRRAISRVKIGDRVEAVVEKVTDDGLVLKLNDDVRGTVRNDHYAGKIKPGDTVKGAIFWINFIHEIAEITLLPKMINAIGCKQTRMTKISIETQLRGDIILVNNWFVLVVLKGGTGKGTIAALPTRRHLNDVEPDLAPYSIGKRIRCYVVLNQSETDMLPICLVKSSFETVKKMNLKRKTLETDEVKSKKIKRETDVTTKEETEETRKNAGKKMSKRKIESETTTFERKRKVSKRERAGNKREKIDEPPESDYSESDENNETDETPGIPECGFFWDNKPDDSLAIEEESSSDDEDDDDAIKSRKKKKKLSGAERREAERQKEREIRQREEALASNEAPNSVDQFDRLVLSSPDSSIVWVQYMAHHLQATEIEKARAVAKRAIKTINFREETERLNVWRAWLNLESRFGSAETLGSVFQDAVRTNDARAVYLHMLTVHADAGRQAELEKIVTTILGKFKQSPEVWHEAGAAFLKIGLKDKSRHIMQRALQSLPLQEHVNLMVKFAQLENKYGDKERSQTLFEQILSSYPKRVDVWSLYVDTLVKSDHLDKARQVLENAVVQTLPARKMKTLFKKFIDFEEKHGSPEGVSRVQQLAVKYVEKECNKDPV